MQAAGESATQAACGAPSGVGWMYLQPMQVTLSPTRFAHYPHKQSIGLGTAQIVLGSLCIVFNAVSLAIGENGLAFVGHGFWCGVMFIVTGAIGISAGVSKTKCKVVSYMVLCIIAAAFTAGLLSCGVLATVIIGYRYGYDIERCQRYGYSWSYNYYYSSPCSAYTTAIAMEGCMAVCAFVAAILFIWGSVLCCKTKPCCYNPNAVQQVPLPPNYAANNGFQVIQPAQFPLPTMPYQQGVPPAYQPSLTHALWMQPQVMQGTSAAAAADPNSPPNPTQVFGRGSEHPPKY